MTVSKETPAWEKVAILTSALAALIAAFIAIYQGHKMRESVEIGQAVTRPFVVIEPASQPTDLSKIVIRVKNDGPVPARMLYESGKTWIASVPLRTSVDSPSRHILYPEEIVVLSEISFDSPEQILLGKQDLRIGYCVLYESVGKGDVRRWVAKSWFFFNPRNRKLEVWKRDETSANENSLSCHIDQMIPEHWFASTAPLWRDKEKNEANRSNKAIQPTCYTRG